LRNLALVYSGPGKVVRDIRDYRWDNPEKSKIRDTGLEVVKGGTVECPGREGCLYGTGEA
jgi:hypothetical protein